MYPSALVPPPGLGGFDAMMPAKVELPSSSALAYVAHSPDFESSANPFTKDRMECGYPAQFQAYEWACKMNTLAPYLNAQAGQESIPHFHNPYVMLQAQLQAHLHQQSLLSELLQLPRDQANTAAAVATAGNPRPPGKGLADSSQEDARLPQKAMDRTKALSAAGHGQSRKVQTLSTSLQLLSGEDPDCLFIVRRINKLGFKAVRTLKRHFSAYGPVLKVLLAHSTVRQHGDPASHARRRPSSLGFIQMTSADATNKVLALGNEHQVDGVSIRVQRFERQRMTEEEEDEAESENEDLVTTPTCKITRRLSEDSMSTAATSASPLQRHQFPPSASPSEATKSPSLSSTAQVVEILSDHDLMA
jgi:hypothetical protein